jgi:hypothetical protein
MVRLRSWSCLLLCTYHCCPSTCLYNSIYITWTWTTVLTSFLYLVDPRRTQPIWLLILYLLYNLRYLLGLQYNSRLDVLRTFEGYCLVKQEGTSQIWAEQRIFISTKIAKPLTIIWVKELLFQTRFWVEGFALNNQPRRTCDMLNDSRCGIPMRAGLFSGILVQGNWVE